MFHSINLFRARLESTGREQCREAITGRSCHGMVWRVAQIFDSSQSMRVGDSIRLVHFQSTTLAIGKPAVIWRGIFEDKVMERTSENALLNWDVFVTPGIPIVTRDLPPN